MSRVIGRGRYATETYPEAPRSGGSPPTPDAPPIDFVYWVGTTDPPPAVEDGTDEAPFHSITACLLAVAAVVPVGVAITILLVGSSPGFTNTEGGIDRSVTLIGMGDQNSIGDSTFLMGDVAAGHDPVVFRVRNVSVSTLTISSSTPDVFPTAFEYFHSSDQPVNDIGLILAGGYVGTDNVTPVPFPLVVNGSISSRNVFGKNAVVRFFGGAIVNGSLDVDSVDAMIGTQLIAADIFVQNVGSFEGLVSCSFFDMAGHVWNGPALSFRADEISGTTFFNEGGALAGGATYFTVNGSGCNNDLGSNRLQPGGRAFGQSNVTGSGSADGALCVGNSNTVFGSGSCAVGNNQTLLGSGTLGCGDNHFSTEGNSFIVGLSGSNFIGASCTHSGGAFAAAGDAQARQFIFRGETPGLAPGESTVLLTSGAIGTGTTPYSLESGKSYTCELMATGTVMGLGAAPRQSTSIYYRFPIDVDSAGVVTFGAGEGFTQSFRGAGLLNAFVDTVVPGLNQLNFVWTMGPGDTVHSRCLLRLVAVEVLGD